MKCSAHVSMLSAHLETHTRKTICSISFERISLERSWERSSASKFDLFCSMELCCLFAEIVVVAECWTSIEDTSALVLRIITYHKLMTNVLCWKIDSIVLGNLKFCISKTWSSSFLFFGVFTPILHINYPKIMNSKLTWRNMVAVLCVKQWQMSACMARQRVDLIARLTLSTRWSVIIYFIFSLWETQR